MANNGKKGVIGILTGGGDVPGLNPAIRAVTIRALREGYQVIGIRRGWAGLVDMVRGRLRQQRQLSLLSEEIVNRAGRTGGTFLHTSRTNPSKVKPGQRSGAPEGRSTKPKERSHARSAEEPRMAGHQSHDSHRRRRHAELRRAARPGRRQGGRHPQDHGQRRSGHRLLHRLFHLRNPHDTDGQQPAHLGGLARALSGARGFRPLRRLHRHAADDGRARRTAASSPSTSSTSSA